MRFYSTRDKSDPTHRHLYTLTEGILQGLAPDGGLLVPESWPNLSDRILNLPLGQQDLQDLSIFVLQQLFPNEILFAKFSEIIREAFSFPIPLKQLTDDTAMLELFHGPTCAFKDFGARFLAKYLQLATTSTKPSLVLVATSGDTGGAVASAFSQLTRIPVIILYPKGRISPRQEKQLCCWGPKVRALAVEGTFDDCQALAKATFANHELRETYNLISANSINLGRLIPQMMYYAYASLSGKKLFGCSPNFVIPSGNVGNSTAAFWAKKLGFPIGKIILAHNSNRAVPNYYQTGVWQPLPTQATLANAMDVGAPSNMERILALKLASSDWEAHAVSDNEISQTIASRPWGEILCPHTATAAFVRQRLATLGSTIIVATAHPAKFETIVEPLIQESVVIPRELGAILTMPAASIDLHPDPGALHLAIDNFFNEIIFKEM